MTSRLFNLWLLCTISSISSISWNHQWNHQFHHWISTFCAGRLMEVKTYSLPGCSLNREHFVGMLLSELIHHFIQLMTELDPKHRDINKWKQIIMRRTHTKWLALGSHLSLRSGTLVLLNRLLSHSCIFIVHKLVHNLNVVNIKIEKNYNNSNNNS